MSHELRTPLNSIIGFSDVIRNEVYGGIGNEKYKDYIDVINRAGRHLLELINEILDVSRIEAGQIHLEEEEVCLKDIVESSLALLANKAEEKSLTITSYIPQSFPHLYGDAKHLRQIFINLLSNAIRFTPEGGRVDVFVKVSSNNAISIEVNDTGIGISERNMRRIIEPFMQVEQSFSRSHEGTGLGLAIVKSLVELHQGQLHITSQLGQGTQVKISFDPARTMAVTTPNLLQHKTQQ
jgi:two-component system cell cycle sensor histidine kinase PleC